MTVTRNPLHDPAHHPECPSVAAEYQGLHVPLSTLRDGARMTRAGLGR